jgi:phosphoglycolate phosphatase
MFKIFLKCGVSIDFARIMEYNIGIYSKAWEEKMTAKYDNILFDLDGTLTDPAEGITNSVAHALEKWNIHVEDKRELNKFVGPPLHAAFSEYYGFSEADAIKCVEYYREYFRDTGIFENKVYDGIAELLAELRAAGKRLIVATSKPEEFAVRILKHFSLYDYFDLVAGATMDSSRVKKADVIAYALENSGITDLSRTLMVGDREHDILGAKAIGMDSLGVLFGYGSREELTNAGATYIAEKVSDISKFIL